MEQIIIFNSVEAIPIILLSSIIIIMVLLQRKPLQFAIDRRRIWHHSTILNRCLQWL